MGPGGIGDFLSGRKKNQFAGGASIWEGIVRLRGCAGEGH